MEKTVPIGAESQSEAQFCFPSLPLVAPFEHIFLFCRNQGPVCPYTV